MALAPRVHAVTDSSAAKPGNGGAETAAKGHAGTLWYLSLSGRTGDAAHVHVAEICSGLADAGWEVRRFEPSFPHNRPGYMRRLKEFGLTQLWLRNALRTGPRPDVLYIRAHPLALPGARAGNKAGVPVVSEVGGPATEIGLPGTGPRFLASMFRRNRRVLLAASAGIVASTAMQHEVGATGATPVAHIPSGADPRLFRPGAATSIRQLPDQYVLYAGALAPWQGIETILAAVDEPTWPSGVHVVIAGDGVLRSLVTAAADGAAPVHHLGLVSQAELAGVLAGSLATLSVQNSLIERGAQPQKLLEGMAAGVPVVATDHPTQNDLIRRERCGVVIPSDDPGALAAAVGSLAGNPAAGREMGQRGRRAVLESHTWAHRVEATDAFLRQVVADYRRGRNARAR